MFEPRFCYRVSAEAGLAYNTETGENAACYVQVKAGDKQLSKDEYGQIHVAFRKVVAEQAGIDVDLVECISQEEYDANVDEDDSYYDDDY